MRAASGRARAWLEIMRISNLPTVASTAIAGGAIGSALAARDMTAVDPALWSLAAPPLAYIGGMILNDAFDAHIDAVERPSRPIPSGRIARGHAYAAGFACLGLALGCAAASGSIDAFLLAVLLVAIVATYDALHARARASVLLLGASRALACLLPMVAFAHDAGEGRHWASLARGAAPVLPAILASWTIGLSIAARGEVIAVPAAGLWPCVRCRHAMQDATDTCPECGADNGALTRIRWANRGRSWHMWIITLVPLLLAVAVQQLVMPAAIAASGAAGSTVSAAAPRQLAIFGIGLAIAVLATWARHRMAEDQRLTPFAVGVWIACLPLLDAMALAAFGAWRLAGLSIGCAALTLIAQRRIAGS
jgi:4-hydroxybenzoate polyprenyltransferase